MRKSIFEIVSSNINMQSEVIRIYRMAKQEKILCVDGCIYYTLFDYVDEYCFGGWEHRGHFIDVNDYLKAVRFGELWSNACDDVDAFLTFIELVYNFWELSYQDVNVEEAGWCGNYFHLKEVMDDLLEQYNHTAYVNEEKNCVLVVEDKSEVTSVSEIVPSALAYDVIKYNHRSLKGQIELKKSILISLGAELEPKRKDLQGINKQLSEDVFFMLNNINIRHNNRSKKDVSKYKEYVAKMTKKQMEKWFDELYQMILLAILLLDNVERSKKVKKLKDNVTGIKV